MGTELKARKGCQYYEYSQGYHECTATQSAEKGTRSAKGLPLKSYLN